MARDEGLLRRWARRKAEARERPEPPAEEALRTPEAAEPEGAPPAPADDGAAPVAEGEEAQADDLQDLPDIDSMDKDSDYSVFMREGVPEALRRRALQKLWRIDPVLANLDGLVEYGDDYTDAATVVEGMKTAYQIGRGYLTEEEHAALAEKPARPPDAQGEGSAELEESAERPAADGEGEGEDEAAAAEPESDAPAGGRQGEAAGERDTDSPATHGKHESS